jgi:organic radical activating enzyme
MKIIYPFKHTFLDYPSDDGAALLVQCIGCSNNCKDCSNPQLQDFNYIGDCVHTFPAETIASQIIQEINQMPYQQIILSGGDVCDPKNIEETKQILKFISHLEVAIYTGYPLEHVERNEVTGFTFLKCGCYDSNLKVLSEKTDDYIQFASTNQRLYDSKYNLISDKGRYYFR